MASDIPKFSPSTEQAGSESQGKATTKEYLIRVDSATGRILARARNRVERVVLALLVAASSIAILTTIGIVWSMVSETFDFFSKYPFQDFFFSLTWSPNFRGGSELGILPLIWGTLYITLISMLVGTGVWLLHLITGAEQFMGSLWPDGWIALPMALSCAGLGAVAYLASSRAKSSKFQEKI